MHDNQVVLHMVIKFVQTRKQGRSDAMPKYEDYVLPRTSRARTLLHQRLWQKKHPLASTQRAVRHYRSTTSAQTVLLAGLVRKLLNSR